VSLELPASESLPSVGNRVRFEAPTLQGVATVRWVQAPAQGAGSRFAGIEFEELEEASRHEVVARLQEKRVRPFIPKAAAGS
jgi:hypothetical protein